MSEETCPSCKKKVQMEFQTKALLNFLFCWRRGEVVETDKFIVKDGVLKDCLASCPYCKVPLVGDLVIKDHKFLKVENSRAR
ncbi:MAG: hypothetical protein ACPLRY_05260 [Candidatus Bathyarchaeales archaeon]